MTDTKSIIQAVKFWQAGNAARWQFAEAVYQLREDGEAVSQIAAGIFRDVQTVYNYCDAWRCRETVGRSSALTDVEAYQLPNHLGTSHYLAVWQAKERWGEAGFGDREMVGYLQQSADDGWSVKRLRAEMDSDWDRKDTPAWVMRLGKSFIKKLEAAINAFDVPDAVRETGLAFRQAIADWQAGDTAEAEKESVA